MDETNRRRSIQMAHNQAHNIVPKTIRKSTEEIMVQTSVADIRKQNTAQYSEKMALSQDPVLASMSISQLQKMSDNAYLAMQKASAAEDFTRAAQLRDEWQSYAKWLDKPHH